MKYSLSLIKYRKKILLCKEGSCEKEIQNVADSFEDDLLEFNYFPVDYFSFFISLLSDRTLYSKLGIWNFILVMSTESHKLKKKHYNEIEKTIRAHYIHYTNKDLLLSVCDFIARHYDYARSKKMLLELQKKDDGKKLGQFATQGLKILSNQIKRDQQNNK